MAKKAIQKKKKKPKASPVISRVKKLAKGIVSAMGTKAKKAQTKAPAKAPPKGPIKPAIKAPVKPQKTAPKTAPKNLPKGPQKPEKQDKKDQGIPGKSGKPETLQATGKQPEGKQKGPKPTDQKGSRPGSKPPKIAKPESLDGLAHDRMCRENGCENFATTKGYCRLDYIKNWKKIKRKEMILKEGKLNQYIEELVSKYPDKYIEVIRQDLSTEVNFTKVIHDLELDETIDDLDYDSDSIDSLIGSIRKEDDIDDTEF